MGKIKIPTKTNPTTTFLSYESFEINTNGPMAFFIESRTYFGEGSSVGKC